MTRCATLPVELFTQTDPQPLGAGSAFEASYIYTGARPTVKVDPSGRRAVMAFARGGGKKNASPWCKSESGCNESFRIIGRAEWGAANPITSRSWEPAIPPGLAMTLAELYDEIVIHHIGNRDDYTTSSELQKKEQSAGYADVPYHFAVDRYGNVFEGRPIGVRGAHVKGANTGLVGVVLLADLDTQDGGLSRLQNLAETSDGSVSSAMRNGVDALVGYLMADYGISHLTGHKEKAGQSGQSRYCPGDLGMAEVTRMRSKFNLKP